jgi:3-oxoacyl-[acyl-carrier protein] reductase
MGRLSYRQDVCALVSGGSRGIGRATALCLAAEGVPVAVNYRQAANEAEEVVSLIERHGGKAVALQADVARASEAAALVRRTAEALGTIGYLVNNAGITRDRLLLQMSESDWDAIWATDLAGARTLAREALVYMLPAGFGRVVNVSSVVGSIGSPGQANYAAAKAAVDGLTRELATSCAPSGVTVNCVIPGYIATDATSQLTPEQQAGWFRRIPMGRSASAGEVASAITFLLSDEAGYITGQCLSVDGGLLAAAGRGWAS